jgi:RNA polymerase sigma-70 factor, ECF subfamily
MSEEELISAAKSGDKKALAELVRKYEKTIYNFAFKISRRQDKAENLMQETFLKMIKSLNQFDGKSKLSTWLYRITVNNYLMELRKNKHRFESIEENNELYENKYAADWNYEPDNIAENNELRNVLDKSIEKLPPDYRTIFMLRDVEGLSTEETANIAKLSVPAVKSRLHRARAFLRNEINEAMKDV